FADELTREAVHEQFPGSLPWSPIGLPETYLALLAPGRMAFIPEGKKAVGHGGIALEEVLVPFVRIQRAAK
ncbi:MAG: BREX-3 system phosphatase PglZ, partial [Myxococcota bacterium]|nr:BREX-3 system phosphatase PglZ [Myxococcota bacterium]